MRIGARSATDHAGAQQRHKYSRLATKATKESSVRTSEDGNAEPDDSC